MPSSTQLELEEIAALSYGVLNKNSIVSATLYVAHVYDGREIKDLAAQTGRDPKDIEKRIDYVLDRLERARKDHL